MSRGYIRCEANKWRRTRILAVLQLNAHRGENDPALTPEEWMPLPGDAEPIAQIVHTPDEIEEAYSRASALDIDLIKMPSN